MNHESAPGRALAVKKIDLEEDQVQDTASLGQPSSTHGGAA